jgi:hypothetical protein
MLKYHMECRPMTYDQSALSRGHAGSHYRDPPPPFPSHKIPLSTTVHLQLLCLAAHVLKDGTTL